MASRNSAADLEELVKFVAEFLRIQDWRYNVFVLPIDVLQRVFSENREPAPNETVYGFTAYDSYERQASIYFARPEDLKRDGVSIEEIVLHELLHVLIDGNRPPGDEILSERAVRTITELLLPRVRRSFRNRAKKPK